MENSIKNQLEESRKDGTLKEAPTAVRRDCQRLEQ